MTKYNFDIEHLEGKGLAGVITSGMAIYTTYRDFAVAAGYPDAIVSEGGLSSYGTGCGFRFNVLARGTHGNFGGTIFVAELSSGEIILINEDGVEMDEAPKPRDLSEMDYVELAELVTDIASERRSRAFNKGYDAGYKDGREELEDAPVPAMAPKLTREEVIEKAKSDVAQITEYASNKKGNLTGNFTYQSLKSSPEYVINKEKRTVVALVRSFYSNEALEKGIAKCDPDDCFNSHIGRAIALRRAFDLMIPHVYLKAPQPTVVRAGDIVLDEGRELPVVDTSVSPFTNRRICHTTSIAALSSTIIDDSRE